jgi:hypothetical protein
MNGDAVGDEGRLGPAEAEMLIATWFVADSTEEGTYFPQLDENSSSASAHAVYWRCILAFYATSLTQNPRSPHAFFTNPSLPLIDGVDFAALFGRWGIEVVVLPITYRLPKGRVGSWGNQFYIFDVIEHLAAVRRWPSAVVLDSDVVWTSTAAPMEAALAREQVLSYVHDLDAYPAGSEINGLTREALAGFATRHGGPPAATMVYCGGEIYAATLDASTRIAARTRSLWPAIVAGEEGAPKEEAHLLSILYTMEGYRLGTADPYIKRMWTTFQHNTVHPADLDLPIWHLPAEKKSGFVELFADMRGRDLEHAAPTDLDLRPQRLARMFGIPKRSAGKLVRDFSAKLIERAKARSGGRR